MTQLPKESPIYKSSIYPVRALLLSLRYSLRKLGILLAHSPMHGKWAVHGPVTPRKHLGIVQQGLGEHSTTSSQTVPWPPTLSVISEQRQSSHIAYLLPIPILDPDIFALLQLFAIFKPLVGWLRVSSSRLTFQ